MNEDLRLAERFSEHRQHLRAVAYRMLGSAADAEDAVQEAWLRLHRSGAEDVANLRAWLTTVVGRICLDMLRSRGTRREESWEPYLEAMPANPGDDADPERAAVVADMVGPALLAVLDTLTPAERVAFVLHDMFAVPFDGISPIVGRSAAATRQLASRARRRVQGIGPGADADRARRRAVVEAFLAASREGDFGALLTLLDPDVELRGDAAVVRMGASERVRGAEAVATTFRGRARAARLALVDGEFGAVWEHGGQIMVAFRFRVAGGAVTGIEMIADDATIAGLDVVRLAS